MEITLSNHNLNSQDHHVTIHVETGLCTFADSRTLELKHLMRGSDFSHPLLTEPLTRTEGPLYHYEYDDIDGLLHAAIYVYSSLLKADNPHACQFKVNPSAAFKRTPFADQIDLSIHSHQSAQESIRITQFEAMISQIMGYHFKFSEDYIINEQFTIQDLPAFVNGDALYTSETNLVELLKKPHNLSRYELRYINPRIGFGVFSKQAIKKGDIISFYCGEKTNKPMHSKNYAFGFKQDCLQLSIDARQQGNIARFINHAPSIQSNNTSCLLSANVEAVHHYLHGLLVVAYTASKEIEPGAQLLVDYGAQFFQHHRMLRFKTNGQLLSNKPWLQSDSQYKIKHFKIMANHGVQKAQMYLVVRMLGIVTVVGVLTGVLHYFS